MAEKEGRTSIETNSFKIQVFTGFQLPTQSNHRSTTTHRASFGLQRVSTIPKQLGAMLKPKPRHPGRATTHRGSQDTSEVAGIPLDREYQIFVKMLDGKTETLSNKIQPTSTVQAVKAEIQERFHIEVEKQGLIFAKKQLENGKCLTKFG